MAPLRRMPFQKSTRIVIGLAAPAGAGPEDAAGDAAAFSAAEVEALQWRLLFLGYDVGRTDGVIVAQGGRFAGWSLYVKDGRLKYCYNFFDVEYSYVEATQPLPDGTLNVRYHFDFESDKPGGGGTGG